MSQPSDGTTLPLPPGWEYVHGRREVFCPHGVGHGGIHGCDGCCKRLPKEMWDEQGRPKLAREELP